MFSSKFVFRSAKISKTWNFEQKSVLYGLNTVNQKPLNFVYATCAYGLRLEMTSLWSIGYGIPRLRRCLISLT